jgi:hypothetical protein
MLSSRESEGAKMTTDMPPMVPSLLPGGWYLRELRRPWKLASFAVGMAWLFYGALEFGFSDWDVGVSVLMGGLTYLCAPWTVSVIAICVRDRPRYWPLWLVGALFVAWAVIDGSYVAYHTAMGHQMLRAENFRASSALYFLAGLLWFYRGSLKELARDLWRVLRQRSTSSAESANRGNSK